MNIKGRRPVVAVLDTGCADHFWFDGVVERRVSASTTTRSATPALRADPELHGDLDRPFDG